MPVAASHLAATTARVRWAGFSASHDALAFPLPAFYVHGDEKKKGRKSKNVMLLPEKDIAGAGYRFVQTETEGAFDLSLLGSKLKLTAAVKSKLRDWWTSVIERKGSNDFLAYDKENDAWYRGSAVLPKRKRERKGVSVDASSSSSTAAKKENSMGDDNISAYEKKRLERIAENKRAMAEIGVESFSKVSSSFAPALLPVGKSAKASSQRPAKRRRTSSRPAAPLAERSSRRLKGLSADGTRKSARNARGKNGKSSPDDAASRARERARIEKEREASLLSKWKVHSKAAGKDAPETAGGKRLFLIPSGPPGVNDHTLHEPVPDLKSHLWGFCEGLYTRIFLHIRPGDVLLFTTAGSGRFNLVAEVRECKVVSKAQSDKFWSRMSYSMGGAAKSNVGFPLLVLIKPPHKVDWPKMDVMRLLGYTDHLQTSRYIRDVARSEGGKAVMGRCLKALK